MNNKRKRALQDLRIISWLLIAIGIIAISGTIIFWKINMKNVVGFILDIGFGIGMILIGQWILSSRKVLA